MDRTVSASGILGERHVPFLLRIALLAGATFLGAWFGEYLNYITDDLTLFWPPTGICLAVLLIGGVRLWPGVFIGAFLANVLINDDLLRVSVGMAAGAVIEAVVGVLLLERIAKFRRNFERQRDVFFFIVFAVLLAPAIGATIEFACLFLDPEETVTNYGFTWLTWWLSNGAGALVVAPAILTFWDGRMFSYRLTRRTAEAVALGAAIVFSGLVAFGDFSTSVHPGLPLAYLPFPFLVWAALRFGAKGATMASLLASLTAVWGSAGAPVLLCEMTPTRACSFFGVS